MKKLLFILLLLPILLQAQEIGRFPFPWAVVVASSEPENMLSNGTFDNTDDWRDNYDSWEITGGVAEYDGVANGLIYQDSASMITAFSPETDYKITFTIDNATATQCYMFFGNGLYYRYVPQTEYPDGTHTVYFTTPIAGTLQPNGLKIFAGNVGGAFTIDNVILELDE